MEVQVIEKIQGRIDRTTGLQINRKLKVAAYARVSTDSEDQLNSFIKGDHCNGTVYARSKRYERTKRRFKK